MTLEQVASDLARQIRNRDSLGIEATMKRMDELGCWRECFMQVTQGDQNLELGQALLWLWTTYGFSVAGGLKANLHMLTDILRLSLPRYSGSPVTLYRGELEQRHRAGEIGIAWTPNVDVARMFCDRRRSLGEGNGVVLRIEATPEMIIIAPTNHSKWLQEDEYIVDPRMIRTVDLPKYADGIELNRITSGPTKVPQQMNEEARQLWSNPSVLTEYGWRTAMEFQRDQARTKNTQKTKNASAKHAKRGSKSRELVRAKALLILPTNPRITRVDLAQKIKMQVTHLSEVTILDHLKGLRMP